jgi:hypothetical protein
MCSCLLDYLHSFSFFSTSLAATSSRWPSPCSRAFHVLRGLESSSQSISELRIGFQALVCRPMRIEHRHKIPGFEYNPISLFILNHFFNEKSRWIRGAARVNRQPENA